MSNQGIIFWRPSLLQEESKERGGRIDEEEKE
jgi:hypothetical protein